MARVHVLTPSFKVFTLTNTDTWDGWGLDELMLGYWRQR